MVWAQSRTRLTAMLTVICAVFFFAAVNEARADTIATPTGVGVGTAVQGTVGGVPHNQFFAGLVRVVIGGTGTWTYCIDIGHGLEMNQPYSEGDWSESNVPDLAKIARILQQHPADSVQAGGDAVQAAAVQAAIWHFSDGFQLTGPSAVFALYTSIVADANEHPLSEPTTSLEIGPSQQTGDADAYLEVNVATTATGAVALAVTPSGGAELVTCDASHTPIGATITGPYPQQLCFHRASAGGPITVTATASATVGAGRVFLRQGSQKLILAASRVVDSHASATATWNEPANKAPAVTLPCPDGGFGIGEPATFTAVGEDADDETLTYAWQQNGVDVVGTSSSISATLRSGDVLSVIAIDSRDAKSAPATLAQSCGHAPPVSVTPPTTQPPAQVVAPVLLVVATKPTVKPAVNAVLGVKHVQAKAKVKAKAKAKAKAKVKAKTKKAKVRTAPVALPHTR